jgi:hypothetical protein
MFLRQQKDTLMVPLWQFTVKDGYTGVRLDVMVVLWQLRRTSLNHRLASSVRWTSSSSGGHRD